MYMCNIHGGFHLEILSRGYNLNRATVFQSKEWRGRGMGRGEGEGEGGGTGE